MEVAISASSMIFTAYIIWTLQWKIQQMERKKTHRKYDKHDTDEIKHQASSVWSTLKSYLAGLFKQSLQKCIYTDIVLTLTLQSTHDT